MSKITVMPKKVTTTKTTAGLSDALFGELDRLRNGETTHHHASAIAKLAVQIINTKKLELTAAHILRGLPDSKELTNGDQTLQLGSD